jgi:hypothetical protein
MELGDAACRPKNAFTLLKVLADSFGKAYLETALDTFVPPLSSSRPSISDPTSHHPLHLRLQRNPSTRPARPQKPTRPLPALRHPSSRPNHAPLAAVHLYCTRSARGDERDGEEGDGDFQ